MLHFNSLLEFMEAFPDENTCRNYLRSLLWESGPHCPHCSETKVYTYSSENKFKCATCKKQFTLTVGTIFEHSRVSLKKWFLAIYLNSAHKKGISSCQLARDINVTQSTAWYMLHRIRETYRDNSIQIMEGVIEADESYVGGKQKNKHYNKRKKNTPGRNMTDKVAVMGIMERGGRVITMSVPNVKADILKPLIYAHVESGNTIITDDWFAYRGLDKYYEHFFTVHSVGNYVDAENPEVHTNNMECYWSHMKRSIIGCYHQVSRKHIDRYCQEWQYRYNLRHRQDSYKFNLALQQSAGRRLSLKQLIS